MSILRTCINAFVLRNEMQCIMNYQGLRHIKRWVSPTQIEITNRKKQAIKKLGYVPIPKRSTFLEWNRSAEIFAFNKRLSEDFNMEKLEQAFTHRSYIIKEEQRQKEMGIEDPNLDIKDNTTFIINGEKLVSEIVQSYLTAALPLASEDVIISLHDYLLSEEILASASLHIGAKDIILTEEHPVAQKTLAEIFFALTAALAESVDKNHAGIFVRDFLIVVLADKDLTEIWNPSQPCEILNNALHKQNRSSAEARLIGHTGTNTLLAAYHIGMYSNKEFLGSGYGQTIQEAKDVAAINVLSRMFGLLDSSNPIKFNKMVNLS